MQGKAAQPGDRISIFSTGLGHMFGMGKGNLSTTPIVLIGGLSAEVLSISKATDGLYQVDVRIPEATPLGDEVPVGIEMADTNGRVVRGNSVHISITKKSSAE